MNRSITILACWLLAAIPAFAASIGGNGGSASFTTVTAFPGSPSAGDVVIVTDDSAVGACDSAAGAAVTLCRWNGAAWIKLGDGTSVGGALSSGDIDTSAELAAIVTNETGTGALVFATSPTLVTPLLGTPTSGVMTNVTGTAAGLTAGLATALAANGANCSAGSFPLGVDASGATETCTALPTTITGTANEITSSAATGAITLSLPTSIDLGGKTSLEIPNGAAPTTNVFGQIAGDNNAWAASRGAVQFYDGTANTFLLGALATDTPANGECPKWNTGGTITWETCASGGAVATDTIFDVAGDLVYGTGSNTAVRLAPGTANQLLRMNAGVTAPEWTSSLLGLTSIDFGSNPADAGRIRLSSNESICWELNTPGVDKCLLLNASDEFELNAPLNITGTASAILLTGVVSPSAPATAEQWYFYADSVDNLPKYIYNGESENTFYTTANPQTTITGNAGTATALAANPADCAANQFATTIAASGALTCAAIVDADIPDTITASNYLPLSGGTLTGSLLTDNLGIDFDDSDVNPTCAAGDYKIYADLSETKLKKCMNGSATDLDTTGGTPSFGTITGGTNTTAAMIVGTGGSLAVSGSGTIAATTAAALAANGGNCSAGSYPLGVGADGAVETCTALASEAITKTNLTLDAEGTGNVLTIPRRIWLPAAGCNNATAGSIWDLPASDAAAAACITGTNTQKGVLDFADGSNLSAQITWKLPSTWTGQLDVNIKWLSATTSGNVVWQAATICVADAETDDPAFNTASGITDATKGTTNQTNDAAITNVTATGCAAGELLHLKVFRDSGDASDTMAGTARLIGVELVMREAI